MCNASELSAVRHTEPRPFLKWAGGKRQLLPLILPLIPKNFKRYFEPFVGGGAVFLRLQPACAVINDVNSELINCYEVIARQADELLAAANAHPNTSEHYYHIREMDRSAQFSQLSAVERAARLLYLNKTCYNGLFRVNSRGEFNVPFGAYKNPVIADPAVILAINTYLNKSDITYRRGDFAAAIADAKLGDFVYFDPPYHPISNTASFTGYSLHGFGGMEQQRLRQTFDQLTERGIKALLSNSDTPYIRELYKNYKIREVHARRAINSIASKRGMVNELLIFNYAP